MAEVVGDVVNRYNNYIKIVVCQIAFVKLGVIDSLPHLCEIWVDIFEATPRTSG